MVPMFLEAPFGDIVLLLARRPLNFYGYYRRPPIISAMEVAMPRLVPIILLLGSISSSSCTSPTIPSLLRDEPAHARGTITEYDSNVGSTFLIEARPDLEIGDKYFVRIDSKTEIFRQTAAGDTVPGDVQDIRRQSRAAIWFEGPILESYPAQGVAKYVLLETVSLD